ncbi:MAG: Hsp70 family protein, partial [Deltaproteobacteria bacterium]|nr:Hsp70 family protein [Deltaproteobacteria bacterium]
MRSRRSSSCRRSYTRPPKGIEGATTLPWNRAISAAAVSAAKVDWAVGEFARRQGAQVPGRLVYSAKSWLSYAESTAPRRSCRGGAAEDVPRLSPVEASARVLEHVRSAWDHAHPEAPLARQDVVLTVPASFDEVARELTVEAAERARIGKLRLIEEPQAAFYDFLQHHENDLEKALGSARLVLVVDVGGGTTDLTLVRVVRPAGGGAPTLERIAVGDHLMLGGDNMDATIARHVEMKLFGKNGALDATRWSGLVQASRLAKETLLSGAGPESYGVAVVGRGSRLLGGAQSYALGRAEAEDILLEGFLPRAAPDDELVKRGRVALTELSLPFAADPAITRHVSAFLHRHAETAART